jgi:trigger factor
MMRDFVQGIESRGMSMEQYIELSGVSDEVIAADITGQAEQSVKEDLALEALFRTLDLGITDEDIDEELELMATATNQDKGEARKQWEEMGLMPVIREQIQHKKAVNWLLDNATVEIAESPSAESGGAEGTKTETAKKGRKKAASKKKTAAEPVADEAAPETEPAAAEPEESEE